MLNQKGKNILPIILICVLGIILSSVSCGRSSSSNSTSTPTISGGSSDLSQQDSNKCIGLNGELEMQVLVGPSEVVGLEPLAVGIIPFQVISDEGTNIIQGNGSISYQDVLEEQWGTYTVDFQLETEVSGECIGNKQSEILYIMIDMSGEQTVEVRAEGFQGDYPWSGSQEYNLSFPIVEGATVEGEGWAFILHIVE
jgi:hypothetical protein